MRFVIMKLSQLFARDVDSDKQNWLEFENAYTLCMTLYCAVYIIYMYRSNPLSKMYLLLSLT